MPIVTILKKMLILDSGMKLPEWIQDLITCCCFTKNYNIQSTAISTMLDLITMSRSMADAEIQNDLQSLPGMSRSQSVVDGTVSVVIMPALLPSQLKFLSEKTSLFKVLTSITLSDVFMYTVERVLFALV